MSQSMHIENPLYNAEITADDPKFFYCENNMCCRKVDEGDKFRVHKSGMKLCSVCGRLYAKNEEEQICKAEDCEE